MDKKFYRLVIILILVFTLLAFLFVIVKNKYSEKKSESALEKVLPKFACNLEAVSDYFKQAIERNELGYCNCIGDDAIKKSCQDRVADSIYFNQALAQYDAETCSNIQDATQKKTCVNLVASAKAQLEKENPSQLARTYLNSGNYEEAVGLYKKLSSQDLKNTEFLANLALAYANQALSQGGMETLISQALDTIDKAIEIDANNPELYRVKGFIYEVKPDISLAIASYNQALDIDSEYIPAYIGRGHANNLLGALEKALEDFEAAKKLDNDKRFVDIYANLCRLQASRGDLMEKAIENCQSVITSSEVSSVRKSETHQILADIYLKLGRDEEALVELKLANSLDSNSPNINVSLAKYYIYKKDYSQAEDYSRKAIESDKLKTVAWNALAYSLYQQSKFEEAIESAQEGLDVIDQDVSLLSPSKPTEKKDLYLVLANIYHQMGDSENEMKYKAMADDVFPK